MSDQLLTSVFASKNLKRPPVWLMRQAGRYLPEYQIIRAKHDDFISFCFSASDAAKVTLQPIQKFDMDAAIIFSDILTLPHVMGQKVVFHKGDGPHLAPWTSDFLKTPLDKAIEVLSPVYDATARVREKLQKHQSLIGFAGAPWTLMAYMLEGQGSKTFHRAKKHALMHVTQTQDLIQFLVELTLQHLCKQIEAGADVCQLFDSWAGLVPESQLENWIFHPTRAIVRGIKQRFPHIPIIGFPRGLGMYIEEYAAKTGVDGISIDSTCRLKAMPKCVVQGNIDPSVLLTSPRIIKNEVYRACQRMKGYAFILNLGHGVLPETPVEHVKCFVQSVHQYASEETLCGDDERILNE